MFFKHLILSTGLDQSGPLIGRFCGNSKNNDKQWRVLLLDTPVIVIPTGSAWVAYLSGNKVATKKNRKAKIGFQLKYTFTGGTHLSVIITGPKYFLMMNT